MGWKVERARNQRAAVATIRDAVSSPQMLSIDYDWQERPGRVIVPRTKTDAEVVATSNHFVPGWFRNAIGEEYFQEPVSIVINEADDPTDVVGAIAKLPELKYARIFFPEVDDNHLKTLAGMSKLHSLALYETKITDKGLEHLRGCPSLRFFEVIGRTDVSIDALEKLKEALPLCEFSVRLGDSTWNTPAYE